MDPPPLDQHTFDALLSPIDDQDRINAIQQSLINNNIKNVAVLKSIVYGFKKPEAIDFLGREFGLNVFNASILAGLLLPPPPPPQAKLIDGFPPLRATVSLSSASIPKECDHASCEREEFPFPFIPPLLEQSIADAPNYTWTGVNKDRNGRAYLSYGSEADIAFNVRNFLLSVAEALPMHLKFLAELTIQELRPDISVLLLNDMLVGVVEVKKPTRDVLKSHPTVLGELFDQMLLVEGFYGMGPTIGILSSGEDWLFAWFPEDSDALRNHHSIQQTSYTTPTKAKVEVHPEIKKENGSPTGTTPSQQSRRIHAIEEQSSGQDEEKENEFDQVPRFLCTTEVLNIHESPELVLRHLCGAFHLMASARLYHRPMISRCLIKFHKDISSITYHSASHETVFETVNFDRFPNSNTKTLIALEDLGRGSTGKAWLCVTGTRPSCSVCVLKFDNQKKINNLEHERRMWHLLYPEFNSKVKIETWSGSPALVMPHFSSVPEDERWKYREELGKTLNLRFVQKNKVHRDVRWRNIGMYRKKDGDVEIILFDLNSVEAPKESDLGWTEKAMSRLYEET